MLLGAAIKIIESACYSEIPHDLIVIEKKEDAAGNFIGIEVIKNETSNDLSIT
jgi:hypothetical protein